VKAPPLLIGRWLALCEHSGEAFSSFIGIVDSQLYQRLEPPRSLDVCAGAHEYHIGTMRAGGVRTANGGRTADGRTAGRAAGGGCLPLRHPFLKRWATQLY